MAKAHMLTTVDNPYNPWTQYEDWWAWDYEAGYHTPGYLARIVNTSDDLSDTDQELAIEQAILEIIELFPQGPWAAAPDPNSESSE